MQKLSDFVREMEDFRTESIAEEFMIYLDTGKQRSSYGLACECVDSGCDCYACNSGCYISDC